MRLNPTVRGLAIVALVAGLVTVFRLQAGLGLVFLVLRIAFIVVIALVLYRLWRERREEIATWSRRSRAVFYGGAALALANLLSAFVLPWPQGGLEILAFFFVLAVSGFAMWRAWQDEHTYGY